MLSGRTHGARFSRGLRSVTLLGALAATAALLAGCAAEPDPTVARDALREVTAEPAAPDALEEYDAEAHPEPIVEPLECSPYLVITARGTGEPKKKQLLGPVARAISAARPGEVERLELDYPADTEINAGATLGARTLIDTLNLQAESCPDQRTILLGYSQGALVIGDALAASDARLVGVNVGAVSEAAAESVLAVVLYGNPRFVGADPSGYGSYSPDTNGILPRPPGSFAGYEGRLRDYCVSDDFICQATLSMEEAGHVAYYDNGMQSDGAAYVITRLGPITERAEPEPEPTEESPSPSPSAGAEVG
ncbi:cutinase family protein [Leucobacter albus]|uniref:Cutinase family protein n=1 Tax=Leucobacter albus TaxID=272210 RepID=A0ABW3TL24_9MICO